MSDNPVGNREPSFKFQWKLSHVFAAVFGVAILLTIFKYVQMNVLAPKTEIRWREFSIKEFEIARNQKRPTVLWIYDPERNSDMKKIETVTRDERIQKSVFLLNALAMKCPITLPLRDSNQAEDRVRQFVYNWVGDLDSGCLFLHSESASASPGVTFYEDNITADKVADRLDEIERQ